MILCHTCYQLKTALHIFKAIKSDKKRESFQQEKKSWMKFKFEIKRNLLLPRFTIKITESKKNEAIKKKLRMKRHTKKSKEKNIYCSRWWCEWDMYKEYHYLKSMYIGYIFEMSIQRSTSQQIITSISVLMSNNLLSSRVQRATNWHLNT